MEQIYRQQEAQARRQRIQVSYRRALAAYQYRHGLARLSWVTWTTFFGTLAFWCFTAYQTARLMGAHTWRDVVGNIIQNAVNVQDKENDALTQVLISYGAKVNSLIEQGQYWRFITPIFLHVNLLHVGLNMLNFLVLGIFLERVIGHTRFLLIYLLTGIISIIASFIFSPQEVSVGASGAIFGLVGAYSVFVLIHRRAFPRAGIPALLWLVIVIGINLAIGFVVPNVDNYAHLGGLVSGFVLGWFFTPLYQFSSKNVLIDKHSLTRHWPLAILAIVGTLVLALVAVFYIGG